MPLLHRVYNHISLLLPLSLSRSTYPYPSPSILRFRRPRPSMRAFSPAASRRLSACASAFENGTGGTNGAAASAAPPTTTYEACGAEEDSLGYRLPPKEIMDIVDAPPIPALSFSPQRDKIVFLQRRALPPIEDLAKPEHKLAGLRIDGSSNFRSRMSFYTGITIHRLGDNFEVGPGKEVHGFPDGAKINFVNW